MTPLQYLSRLLRTEEAVVEKLIRLLEARTGKRGIPEAITDANKEKVGSAIKRMGIPRDAAPVEILRGIAAWVRDSEASLLAALAVPSVGENSVDFSRACETLSTSAYALAGNAPGFFLKIQKARQMIEQHPPPNMLKFFGYKDAREFLARENLFEIWAALRFVESREWMNETFLAAYKELTPNDFEERPMRLFVLPQKWLTAAERFVQKKYHNVSHLKELGVIFIVPIPITLEGVMLRIFMLLLHYLHEVPFYSRLFKRAQAEGNFVERLISYLRGDVQEVEHATDERQVLVIQRYLAKDDPNDKRLFMPHVNPEAIHWRNAENDLARYAKNIANPILEVWQDLDWVGEMFDGILVPFNLIDSVMSLISWEKMSTDEGVERLRSTISKETGNPDGHIEVKYRYHHQEALWNKIFVEYLGEQQVEDLIVEHLRSGYFTI